MKRLAFLLAFVPSIAWAQVPPPSPQIQALSQKVMQLTGESLDWQSQAIALKAQVDDLQKQLDALKAAPPPASK